MKNKIAMLVVVLLLVLVGVLGYFQLTKEEGSQPTAEKLSPVLNIYNWEDYFGETTIEDFEKEFGVKVNLETYEDELVMLATVQSDPKKHDIIIASDTLIQEMVSMQLLAQIDMANIPNFKNIAEEFKNHPYDPENKHSVPYMWGTSGLAVNRKYIKETEPSWSILWNSEYKGKISMLSNMHDTIGAALFYLGYSGNSTNPAELAEAKNLLLKQKPILRGYEDSATIMNSLISEELWAGHSYSGVFASAKNENVEYLIPKEGAFIWTDTLAIPISAQHKYTAELFINFILRPDVSAKIANYLWYANTNKAAKELTNPEILQDPTLYPPEEVKKKLERNKDAGELGEAIAIYNQIWAELQRSE